MTTAKVAGSCNASASSPAAPLVGDMFDGKVLFVASWRKGRVLAGARVLWSAARRRLRDRGFIRQGRRGGDCPVRRLCETMNSLAERLRMLLSGAEDRARLQGSRGFDVVVNATPLGMKEGDPLPMDVARIAPSAFVGEVVMKQEITPFLAAQARVAAKFRSALTCCSNRFSSLSWSLRFRTLHRTSSGPVAADQLFEAASETDRRHRERDARPPRGLRCVSFVASHFEGNEASLGIALRSVRYR